ncbi:MAG: hypothetical protein AAFN81_16735 [Bacteroidota bacterium]
MVLQSTFRKYGPKFWQRFDDWLLTHHPLSWLSAWHCFAVIALFLCSTVLALGVLMPVSLGFILTEGYYLLLNFIVALSNMLVLYLAYGQLETVPRHQLPIKVFGGYILIGSAFVFCCYLSVVTHSYVVANRTAVLIEDTLFEQELRFHKDHNFWCCSGDALLFEQNDSIRHRILRSFDRYGLEKPVSVGYTFCDGRTYDYADLENGLAELEEEDREIVEQELRCLLTRSSGADQVNAWSRTFGARPDSVEVSLTPVLRELRGSLIAIEDAKITAEEGLCKSLGNNPANTIFLIFSLMSFLLILIYNLKITIHPKKWQERMLKLLSKIFDFRHYSWFQRIDQYILTHHPVLWMGQLHAFWLGFVLYYVPALLLLWIIGLQVPLGDVVVQRRLYLGGQLLLLSLFVLYIAFGPMWKAFVQFEYSYFQRNKSRGVHQFIASLLLGLIPYLLGAWGLYYWYIDRFTTEESLLFEGVAYCFIAYMIFVMIWFILFPRKSLSFGFYMFSRLILIAPAMIFVPLIIRGEGNVVSEAFLWILIVFLALNVLFYLTLLYRASSHLSVLVLAATPCAIVVAIAGTRSWWLPLIGASELSTITQLSIGTVLAISLAILFIVVPLRTIQTKEVLPR